MTHTATITITITGENIISLQTGKEISEENHAIVVSFMEFIRSLGLPYLKELVPAYCSLTLYFDLEKMAGNLSISELRTRVQNSINEKWKLPKTSPEKLSIIEIPVCYEDEFAPDMEILVKKHNLSPQEIIRIHSADIYRVYMVGFAPGFPYMGIVSDKIATPRKDKPALNIAAGSVGIAAKQTGIYPVISPGGWNIIGRTPLKIFDSGKEDPFLLKTGNRVRFKPVSKQQFLQLKDD